MLTQFTLKKHLAYLPATGQFYRDGIPVGGINKTSGYVVIYIDGTQYYAHRLAWLYVHGKWPDNHVDHINECRSDNRIENLRDVPRGTNALNRSKFGIGIHFRKDRGTWLAHIGIDDESINLGTYPTKEEALAARHAAKKVLTYLRE